MNQAKSKTKVKKRNVIRTFWNQRYLMLLVLPGIVWLIIFCYVPMYGVLIAFKDYNVGLGIMQSPWVGLTYFREMFSDPWFFKSLRNTIIFSLLDLIVNFPFPIIFALLINELTGMKLYKRVIQTVSYLPHFLSWAFVASFLFTFTSDNGALNSMIYALGYTGEPIAFMTDIRSFAAIIVLSSLWKSFGYSSIIYLAAMTSIDQEMYEAATIDGAKKLQRIWYITLPSIKPTISVLLILSVSSIIGSNFEQFYLQQNSFVSDWAKVLSVYTYEIGFQKGRFSYGTAVGLFTSLVSFILIVVSNQISKKVSGEGIY